MEKEARLLDKIDLLRAENKDLTWRVEDLVAERDSLQGRLDSVKQGHRDATVRRI